MRLSFAAGLTAALATVAACGSPSSKLEGIYTVDAWNSNPASCADPGMDISGTMEPLFYIKLDSLLGTDFINVVPCTDMTACSTMANDDGTIHLGHFILDKGNDKNGWTGTSSYAFGPDPSGSCMGGVSTAVLTADGDTAVQVRDETIDVAAFAPSGGECRTEDAEAAAATLPCTSLELVHGTFAADF